METVNVEFKLPEEVIQKHVQQMIEEHARPQMLFWDAEQISAAISFSKPVFEQEIASDPRMLLIQRRRSEKGKKIWPVKESVEIIQDIIMNNWL